MFYKPKKMFAGHIRMLGGRDVAQAWLRLTFLNPNYFATRTFVQQQAVHRETFTPRP